MTAAVSVEINVAGPNTGLYLHLSDITRGILDTNTLGPDTGLWTEIGPYVRSFTIDRGSRRVDGPIVRYEAGTCTIVLDNSDRRFDPTNLNGPYVAAGATQLTPMRGVRIRATFGEDPGTGFGIGAFGTGPFGTGDIGSTGVYDLFRGHADAWQIAYRQPSYSEVTLTATDGFKILANNDRAPVGAVGANENTGARITRILDSAGWPTGDRIVAVGNTTMQATTLEGDALAELQLTADTEWGEFYVDGAGRTVFRNRIALYQDARSNTSQGIFGDHPGELEYDDVVPEYDDTMIFNQVRITRVGGTAQTAEDATSQLQYLIHTFDRSDLLMETDAVALAYAQHVLFMSKDPELRFASMIVDPTAADPVFEEDHYPQALGRQLGDRITIIRRPPGGGDPIERDAIIRGISHNVDAVNSMWKTTWTLQDAPDQSVLILDHAIHGKLNFNVLTF